MKTISKKYIIYISVGILAVLLAITLATYALFFRNTQQESTNVMGTLDCIDLSFVSNNDSISLINTYPLTNEEGLMTTPYSFTVANNCNNYVEYRIIASIINNVGSIPAGAVKVSVSGDGSLLPTVLNTLNATSTPEALINSNILATYIVTGGTFENQESDTYNFQMWLDGENEDVWNDETISNKSITIKLSIIGIVKTPETHITIILPDNPMEAYSTGLGNITWSNKLGGLEINSLSHINTTVELINEDISSSPTLANHIKSLNNAQGVYNEPATDWRYEGANPANYIWFNNELWRIIGVFADNTHGKTGESLVKIIRDTSLGGYVWDKNNVNNWANSSLYNLLNSHYYTGTNEPTLNYCYQNGTTIPGLCNFTKNGITSSFYRNMIENVTWKLGGSIGTLTTATVYGNERGGQTVSGYIGLMYPSDYGYATLAVSCSRSLILGSYGTLACGGGSWLRGNGHEWTLMRDSSSSTSALIISNMGTVSSSFNTNIGYAVRPTLYLKQNIKKISGTGTHQDPYIVL